METMPMNKMIARASDTPYPSELDPSNVPPFKPYQHLSRSREWLYGDNADE